VAAQSLRTYHRILAERIHNLQATNSQLLQGLGMETKSQRMKKKAQTALKSLFGSSAKSAKSDQPSSSLSSIQGGSSIAETADNSPASSEQATTGAGSVISRLGKSSSASEVASDRKTGTNNETAGQPSNSSSLTPFARQKTSRCFLELTEAMDIFRKNYVQFAKANSEYILIDDELENVLPDIATITDVKQIAKIFEQNVTKTIRINARKKLLTETHWPAQVTHFLSKLYPIAKLSCNLMGAVAEVAQ
jgi:hypothetical protein